MGPKEQIEKMLYAYETAGLIEGNPEKVLSMMAEDIIGIGMGEQGIVSSKAQVKEIILTTIKADTAASYALEYEDILINLIKDTAANLCAKVIVKRTDHNSGDVTQSAFSQSLSFAYRNGEWLITALHATPIALSTESIESYPMTFADNTLSQLRAEMKEKTVELLNNSISGGVIGIYITEVGYPLYLINDSMLSYLGYTEEEFREKFQEDVSGIIAQDYIENVFEKIHEAQKLQEAFEFYTKVCKKDGTELSMIVRHRFAEDLSGNQILLGVFTDVTQMAELQERLEKQTAQLEEQAEELSAQNEELLQQQKILKNQADELAVSEERFRIALEKTSNIIFDCDMISGNILHSSVTKTSFNFVANIGNAKENLVIGGAILDEDLPAFLKAYSSIKNGSSQAECVVKVKVATGKIIWNKISMTGIQDATGVNVRAIGLIEDITLQTEAEIAESELKHKSELDSLTKIYNKGSSEQKIIEKLGEKANWKTGIFIMLDVDCFKHINDTYGHPFGDEVLKNTAAVLLNHFRDTDIVGRMGGDEFCVFCSGIKSREQIRNIVLAVAEQIKSIFITEQGTPGVTCSIGIAQCCGRKKNFEQLYHEADTALYRTKANGKNGYTFFQELAEHKKLAKQIKPLDK